MGLKTSGTFKGLDAPQAYHKITKVSAVEKLPIEDPKKYTVVVNVQTYADSTKTNQLEMNQFYLEFSVPAVSLSECYAELKKEAKFLTAIDE